MVAIISLRHQNGWISTQKTGLSKGFLAGLPFTREHLVKKKPLKLTNITIDVGCYATKEEVEKLGIHVGCVITYPDTFQVLNKDKFVCRALDNRIGGFMIAEVGTPFKR